MNEDINKIAEFEVNKYGWTLLFRKLGSKIIIRAENIKPKNKRVANEQGHRMAEVETEGGTVARSKYGWDIRNFPSKN